MPARANTSYLRLECLRASTSMRITLRPFVAYRDHHSQSRGEATLRIDADAQECRVQACEGATPYRLRMSRGRFSAAQATYYRVPYDLTASQGRILMAGLPERLAIRLREGR